MDGQPPRQAEWKTIDMFRHVVPPRLTQGSNQADRSDRLFRAVNDGACGVAHSTFRARPGVRFNTLALLSSLIIHSET